MHVGRLKLAAQRAMGLLSEARILYGRCLEARPNDAGVLANRALVLLRLGRLPWLRTTAPPRST